MTDKRRLQVSPIAAVFATVAMLIVGAGGMYFVMQSSRPPGGQRDDASAVSSTPPTAASSAGTERAGTMSEVVVPLTKDAIDRAGITVARASMQTAVDSLRVPGVIEPNAYRQVSVTSLVAGRVVGVSAELGERVRKGQSIAQVYSPDLADARTKYVAAKALLSAHDRELQRTQKLVEIGAASRQELERIHAEHSAQTAEVEAASARLRLLGVTVDAAPSSNTQAAAIGNVPAPITGVVTERFANVGLNVDQTTRLFTVVDLASVWIVADVYERDLKRVREGVRATISTTAYPDRHVEGRVSFIDPQLNATTRTAKIRVEVANPDGALRPGMYADVVIDSVGSTAVLVVPKEAVQSVGDRQVVYQLMPGDPAKFIQRDVRVGRALGDSIEILAGLSAGDSVASKGSFFVRAEAERLGLQGGPGGAAAAADERSGSTEIQTAKIAVTETGFEPSKVTLRAGTAARLTFVRVTDKTCATEVVFPSLSIKRALPLNQPVVIAFTPTKTGDVAFACGMNMLKGAVVVQ